MLTEYEITKDDLSAFNLYHHFHSATGRRQYLRSWFVPAFMWLLACTGIWYLADRERGTPLRTFLDLWPLFSGVPLYLLCFPWAYRRKVAKIIAGMVSEGHNRGLFGHHRVALSPEGITDSTDFGQSSTAWRAVERVARNGDYAFVYINALAAIIIPRRAFRIPTEFDEFVRTASSYHEKAAAGWLNFQSAVFTSVTINNQQNKKNIHPITRPVGTSRGGLRISAQRLHSRDHRDGDQIQVEGRWVTYEARYATFNCSSAFPQNSTSRPVGRPACSQRPYATIAISSWGECAVI